MTASDVKRQLDGLGSDVTELGLIVSSPGGDVIEGYAIFNLLDNLDMKITVEVIGGAMSAMSVIILAGDVINVRDLSVIMIHNPWTVAGGDSDAFLSTAALLQSHEVLIARLYAKKTGHGEAEMLQLMKDEKYFFPEEAVAFGFADKIVEGTTQIGNSADMVKHCQKKCEELRAKLSANESTGLADKLAAMRERRALSAM